MEDILNVREIKDYMIGYHIVNKIYEIRDNFYFSEDGTIEIKELLINLKVLDYIREINFVFVKNVGILDQIKEKIKVGNLLNFQVYLDPIQKEDNVIFFSDKGVQIFKLKIQF